MLVEPALKFVECAHWLLTRIGCISIFTNRTR